MQIDTSEITTLTLDQKVQLLELISDALVQEGDCFSSPEWHKSVLDSREAELRDKTNWIPLDQARAL